jgi:phosphocarrier protein HPr
MPELTVRVASTNGLHARPATLFTQAVTQAGIPVQLTKNGKSVNAASILGVISLGVNFGDEVTLSAEGDLAEALLLELTSILTTDHDAVQP